MKKSILIGVVLVSLIVAGIGYIKNSRNILANENNVSASIVISDPMDKKGAPPPLNPYQPSTYRQLRDTGDGNKIDIDVSANPLIKRATLYRVGNEYAQAAMYFEVSSRLKFTRLETGGYAYGYNVSQSPPGIITYTIYLNTKLRGNNPDIFHFTDELVGTTTTIQTTLNTTAEITFHGNGADNGQDPQPIIAPRGTQYPDNFGIQVNRRGHTFTYWSTSPNGMGRINDYYAPIFNTDLYAQWQRNSYTQRFNGNGQTGALLPVSRTVEYDATSTVPAGPTRTGYTFAGWYDTNAATGGTQLTTSYR
ncbi:InlB B-repeat-containing protein, partial [Enterococcus termitis]